MKPRILVAIVGIPALIGAIWVGFPALTIVVGAAAFIGLWEFHRMAKAWNAAPYLPYSILWTGLFIVHSQLAADHGNFSPYLIAGGLVPLLIFALIRRNRPTFQNCLHTAIGPLYVGFLLSHALLLREGAAGLEDGRAWLLYALLITFAADTGAFFVGKLLGRRKMAPTISPGKTWEGFAGGLAAATGASIGLTALLDLPISLPYQLSLGLLLAIVAALGDLAESWMKRRANLKDSGVLLPRSRRHPRQNRLPPRNPPRDVLRRCLYNCLKDSTKPNPPRRLH